ncbi:hypothetical protein E4U53_007064 [Claviceps sorghi]|nr:hypothetical protein E4U53_007064 [Claviceps sorghi]
MAVSPSDMDAHQPPSDEMRADWKSFAKLDPSTLTPQDPRIDDPRGPLSENGFRQAGQIGQSQAARAFAALDPELAGLAEGDVPVLHHPLLPDLLVVPRLVPPEVQKTLLRRMLHRHLSDPNHQTNLHLHYTLPYQAPDPHARTASPDSSPPPPPPPPSFFSLPSGSPSSSPPCFLPKDPAIHKPLTAHQVLTRRLHWLTLGGQYDWTNRVYPNQEPPPFPADLARFLETLFPETRAQAAIVNFYTPGDTMMMHRDVSEHTDKGLISLSFGCDCLFIIAPATPPPGPAAQPQRKKYLVLRLRSGDAIYMTREARYAWHGVPKVLPGTCPEYLHKWPSENGQYTAWEGWMGNKRINLNVRQMRD